MWAWVRIRLLLWQSDFFIVPFLCWNYYPQGDFIASLINSPVPLFAFSTIHSSYTSLKHEIKQLAVSFNIDSGTKHKTLGETNESYLRKEQGYSF
jgi:hypothetical protein